MKTYCQNGTIKEIPHFISDADNFQIQELENETVSKYIYPGGLH